jgi:cysteine desulfurase
MYAPVGSGILFVNSGLSVKPMSIYSGGFQQEGVRAGTISPVLSFATAYAFNILNQSKEDEINHLHELRELFIKLLHTHDIQFNINGSISYRHPGNLNISLADIENSASFIYKLQPNVCISSGSACNSGVVEPSYVLKALGLKSADIERSIRIGFGRFNNRKEIESCVEFIVRAIKK